MPKFDVDVTLVGQDGNAFAILAAVRRALHDVGASREQQDQFIEQATSGDYDHLLRTATEWVNVH